VLPVPAAAIAGAAMLGEIACVDAGDGPTRVGLRRWLVIVSALIIQMILLLPSSGRHSNQRLLLHRAISHQFVGKSSWNRRLDVVVFFEA